MPADIQALITQLEQLTVLEMVELKKALEDKWGVVAAAAAPVAVATAPTAGGDGAAPAEAAEEKTEFDVVLTDIGANKIQVIKAVRELTTLGLKEAKDLVEAAPTKVKEAVPKDEAEAARAKLEEAGAKAAVQ